MAVNYNHLAAGFDERYRHRPYSGIEAFLIHLADRPGLDILEVGCGTGHWLSKLKGPSRRLFGVDRSVGMLATASSRLNQVPLACAAAENPPFSPDSFDLIFCVNAFHHFQAHETFIHQCRQALRNGGRLAIIGLDPHLPKTRWYLYEYFEGVQQLDMQRYHPQSKIQRLMMDAGFQEITTIPVEHLQKTFVGKEVLADPFLQRESTSQLQLISEEEYRVGLDRIGSAIARSEVKNEPLSFTVDLTLAATVGAVRG